MVHMFSAQPQPTTRSAPAMSSAARGWRTRRRCPRSNGSPGEQAVGHRRRGDQRAVRRGQRGDLGARPSGAATGHEDRPVAPRRAAPARSPTAPVVGRTGSAARAAGRRRAGRRGRLHVERQAEHHGPTLVHGRPVGPRRRRPPRSPARAPARRRRRRARQGVLVDPEVGARPRPRRCRRRAPSAGSGSSPPRRCRSSRWSARSPGAPRAPRPAPRSGRTVGHRRRPALVAGGDERHAAARSALVTCEVAAAHDAEGVPDAELGQQRAPTTSATGAATRSPLVDRARGRARDRAGEPVPPTIGSGRDDQHGARSAAAGRGAAAGSGRTCRRRAGGGAPGTAAPSRRPGPRRCRRSRPRTR